MIKASVKTASTQLFFKIRHPFIVGYLNLL